MISSQSAKTSCELLNPKKLEVICQQSIKTNLIWWPLMPIAANALKHSSVLTSSESEKLMAPSVPMLARKPSKVASCKGRVPIRLLSKGICISIQLKRGSLGSLGMKIVGTFVPGGTGTETGGALTGPPVPTGLLGTMGLGVNHLKGGRGG